MGDNRNLVVLASDAHKMIMPEINIPQKTPGWAREMFPPLIQSIYDSSNQTTHNLVVDFNRTIEHLQAQINQMEDKLEKIKQDHSAEINMLRESIKQKQYQTDNQANVITELKDTINKNESYSRRDNLIFGGFTLARDEKRSCADMVREEVFCKALGMTADEANSIKFVRCHVLSKKPDEGKLTIIARFQSFHDRSMIWNKRRSLKVVFVTEDYPYEIRKKRNKLKPILKAAGKNRNYANSISLKSDKLLFRGELLSVDKLHKLPKDINPRTLSEVKTNDVLVFGGINSDYHELSNFYSCAITFRNQQYTSSEQAYQHSKALLFGDDRAASAILRSSDPAQQKFIARNIRAFNNRTWNTSKVALMKDILHCKFVQHPDIAKQLCSTGDLSLGEAIQRDNFYGIGMPLTHKQATDKTKWQTNKLGELLMAERTVQRTLLNM